MAMNVGVGIPITILEILSTVTLAQSLASVGKMVVVSVERATPIVSTEASV